MIKNMRTYILFLFILIRFNLPVFGTSETESRDIFDVLENFQNQDLGDEFFEVFRNILTNDLIPDDFKRKVFPQIINTSIFCSQIFADVDENLDNFMDVINSESIDDGIHHGKTNRISDLNLELFEEESYVKLDENTTLNSIDNDTIYLSDMTEIIQSIKDACKSLPENVPDYQKRTKRSAENMLQIVAVSLEKWVIISVSNIENKIENFLVHCFQNSLCQNGIQKTVHKLMKYYHSKPNVKQSIAVLEDLMIELQNLMDGNKNPVDESSNFILENDFYVKSFKEEENEAFKMAEKLHPPLHSAKENHDRNEDAEIQIEMEAGVARVPDTFLSVAFGSSIIQHGWGPIKSEFTRFIQLASALSPSVLRVGGSAANFLTFSPETKSGNYPKVKTSTHPKFQNQNGQSFRVPKGVAKRSIGGCDPQIFGYKNNFVNFTMSKSDWSFLLNMTETLNWTLLFDLNQFYRNPDGNWDPSNAEMLTQSQESKNSPIIWQLGNEPNAYNHHFNWTITPEQSAVDFRTLRDILEKEIGPKQSVLLVGPDVTRPKHFKEGESELSEDSMDFLERFLKEAVDEVDAVTWHHYYMNGRTATVEDFLNPTILNVFPKQVLRVASLREKYATEKPIWITETATAWGGGAHGLSDRFVSCFPWLDKLGSAALLGVSNIFRQTLYGGCYGLLDSGLNPNPTYWVTVLHKQLMGEVVLLPRSRLVSLSIRLYAHCLKRDHRDFKPGAIVILGLNLSDEDQVLKIVNEELNNSPKYLYKLTAPGNDLKSRNIQLNGRILHLTSEGSVPEMQPVLDTEKGLRLSPHSINFWVFPEANGKACY